MADSVTRETIEYVCRLAELELTGEEAEKAAREMKRMLDYVDKLKELDTLGAPALLTKEQAGAQMRKDEVVTGDPGRKLLQSAPQIRDGKFYGVPRTIR